MLEVNILFGNILIHTDSLCISEFQGMLQLPDAT